MTAFTRTSRCKLARAFHAEHRDVLEDDPNWLDASTFKHARTRESHARRAVDLDHALIAGRSIAPPVRSQFLFTGVLRK